MLKLFSTNHHYRARTDAVSGCWLFNATNDMLEIKHVDTLELCILECMVVIRSNEKDHIVEECANQK